MYFAEKRKLKIYLTLFTYCLKIFNLWVEIMKAITYKTRFQANLKVNMKIAFLALNELSFKVNIFYK